MQVSLGFIIVLILVVFPGLLFRRLFFYGEFSKQYNSGLNIISLIAISSIPGVINLSLIFGLYDYFISPISIGEIIDRFKEIVNPDIRPTNCNSITLNELVKTCVAPFVCFLYISVFIMGVLSGRLIRFTKLDARFKLLRFKNYWFYLFKGYHSGFKKLKHLKQKNSKYLFTKADILIDSYNKTILYSGIIVDYELQANDSKLLSMIVLEKAERYSTSKPERGPIKVPGNLFVVDCSTMKNINLTYIYKEKSFRGILKSKIPYITEILTGILILIMIPLFIFKADVIESDIYTTYFEYSWIKKVVLYLIATQVIVILNPFKKKNNEYNYINFWSFNAKIIWMIIFFILFLML